MSKYTIEIFGRGKYTISHLLLDMNGTVALDGNVIEGVKERLEEISKLGIIIKILTADTHGTAKEKCKDLPVSIYRFNSDCVSIEKEKIVNEIGANNCIAIGNGYNDNKMLKAASIGVVVVGKEGAFAKSLFDADVICVNIIDALDMIIYKKRLIATLRD